MVTSHCNTAGDVNIPSVLTYSHLLQNPDCADCAEKFDTISNAYRVLSNPDKRAMYDQVEISYEPIKSDAVELTAENIDQLVYQSDAVWFIQVYSDWHKSCIRFANPWEETSKQIAVPWDFFRLH